jgi:hypothetical protein
MEPTRYARGTRSAPGLFVVLDRVVRLARLARGSCRCRYALKLKEACLWNRTPRVRPAVVALEIEQ